MTAKVFIILGPTSSGKTSLALSLCKKFSGEIISCDSRQIYKGMDIGTGKIPVMSDIKYQGLGDKWVLDGVGVWGYDLAFPNEYFSAYDYAKFALEKIGSLLKEGKRVFLVGGTGFYIDAIVGRVQLAGVKPDFELRETLKAVPTEELVGWLTSLNLDVAGRIDTKNRARVVRALEIELRREKTRTSPPLRLMDVEYEFIGLNAPRSFLYQKADCWLEFVWENGLLSETSTLLSQGYRNTEPLSGLIYKSAVGLLDGKVSDGEARDEAKFDLHAYIRRQQTYFKRNKDIGWFDITGKNFAQEVADAVESNLDG